MSGLNQTDVAAAIGKEFGGPFTQSQVSRAVRRVDEWLRGVQREPEPRRQNRRLKDLSLVQAET